jgi:hypothetical protein
MSRLVCDDPRDYERNKIINQCKLKKLKKNLNPRRYRKERKLTKRQIRNWNRVKPATKVKNQNQRAVKTQNPNKIGSRNNWKHQRLKRINPKAKVKSTSQS